MTTNKWWCGKCERDVERWTKHEDNHVPTSKEELAEIIRILEL